MKYILDTNSIIYWIKSVGNFENKINQLCDENIITTTIITICEIYYGVEKSKKKDENLKILNEMVEKIGFENIGEKTPEIYGKIKFNLQSKGIVLDDFDLLIASICIEQNAVLVTDNVKHFERIKELKIENWK